MKRPKTDPYITSEGLPIVGRVIMDFISLELEKEEVCVMADAQIVTKQFGTISYEVTGISCYDLKRSDLNFVIWWR